MVFALLSGLARTQALTYGNGTDEVRRPRTTLSPHSETWEPFVSS